VENAPSAAVGLFLYGRGVVAIDDGRTKIDFEKTADEVHEYWKTLLDKL
jgi:hypothetical protein